MKRAILTILGTVSGLVLLLSFKTHPASSTGTGAAATAPTPTATEDSGSGSSSASPGTSSGSAGKSTSKSGGSSTRTVTGNSIDTRWGPVQLRVTLKDGKITKIETLRIPDENPRDQEINSFAVPQLNQEALSAQSAQIDTVSGATVTSEGYIQSLQSALDKAGR